jgi:hypothetical protein
MFSGADLAPGPRAGQRHPASTAPVAHAPSAIGICPRASELCPGEVCAAQDSSPNASMPLTEVSWRRFVLGSMASEGTAPGGFR